MSFKPRFLNLCLVILAIIVVVVVILQSSEETERRLAELRNRGIPTTATELNDFYVIPEGQADATKLWVAAIDAVQVLKADPARDALPLIGSATDPIPSPGQPWAQLEESEKFVRSHQNVINLIHAAAASGGIARYPDDFTGGTPGTLSYPSNVSLAVKLLELDAWVSVHRENPSAGFTNVTSMFAASKSLMAEPSLTAQSIRQSTFTSACRCMIDLAPSSQWTEEQIDQLQRFVAEVNVLKEVQKALIGDRANFLSTVSDPSLNAMNSTTVAAAIDLYERFIVSMESGWPKAWEETDKVTKAMKEWTPEERASKVNSAVAIVFPAVRLLVANSAETATRQRAALLTLASLRYEKTHGTRPSGVDQLKPFVEQSFGDVWTDPVTHKPMRFQNQSQQIVIYGAGRDRTDDNGQVTTDKATSQPLDVGYRF